MSLSYLLHLDHEKMNIYCTTTFDTVYLWQTKNIIFISPLRGLHCNHEEKYTVSFRYYVHYAMVMAKTKSFFITPFL